jgi:hypothetical protein
MNATKRAVRGESRTNKLDGIYRATQRGDSTHTRERTAAVAIEMLNGGLRIEPGKAKLVQTREDIELGWLAVSEILARQGQADLAAHARRFVGEMAPARTEKEQIEAGITAAIRDAHRKEKSIVR